MLVAPATSSFVSVSTCPIRRQNPHSHKVFSLNHVSNPKTSNFTHENTRLCECFDLYKELVPYEDAWNWQKDMVREKKMLIDTNEECPDTLIILQHHPVFTMGTHSSIEYLNFDVKDSPYEVYRTERGGEVTYHGPGQLVVYPIINLRNHKMDIHWYLRALEEVVIRVLSSTFAIKASRIDGLTGVWVGDEKLAAIGVKVSRWVTYHGLALNVTTDLTPFDWIVPCGIKNRKVGNIKNLLGIQQLSGECARTNTHDLDDTNLIDITYKSLVEEFSEVFQFKISHKTIHFLESNHKSH